MAVVVVGVWDHSRPVGEGVLVAALHEVALVVVVVDHWIARGQ